MNGDIRKFTPFSKGELIPMKGYFWRVVDCNPSTVTLQVFEPTKAGKERGLVIKTKSSTEIDKE